MKNKCKNEEPDNQNNSNKNYQSTQKDYNNNSSHFHSI
jgi:hypothetical protein